VVTTQGNYGTFDRDLLCQFVVSSPNFFSNPADKTCVDYDQQSCSLAGGVSFLASDAPSSRPSAMPAVAVAPSGTGGGGDVAPTPAGMPAVAPVGIAGDGDVAATPAGMPAVAPVGIAGDGDATATLAGEPTLAPSVIGGDGDRDVVTAGVQDSAAATISGSVFTRITVLVAMVFLGFLQ
jgi:hypothetical protein